jgi:uncharacterized membrane protein
VNALRLGIARQSRNDEEKVPLGERARDAFLKPAKPGSGQASAIPETVEELDYAVKHASDKERLVGLFAAPVAAAIGIIVYGSLVSHDPAARLKSGAINKLHVSLGLYHEVLIAFVVIALVMMATAWFRKRMYLGIVTALYGLTLFNLHYWGFAIPFLMCGAWLLVRAYRLQKAMKEAGGSVSRRVSPSARGAATVAPRAARANKRYTPPTSSARRT